MKCTPSAFDGSIERCKACAKADKDCKFTYVHKKPGRPLGSTKRRAAPTPTAPTPGPMPGSMFGSARVPLSDPSVLGLLDAVLPPAPTTVPLTSVPTPLPLLSPGDSNAGSASAAVMPESITAILPWEDASFFLSLYLTHQHCLVPVVHKPTFAQSVLARRDLVSPEFRALLSSVIAFTICQCPISAMASYERADLARWAYACLAHNDALRERAPAGLQLLTASTLDWVTAQALGAPTDVLVAHIGRYIGALRLREDRTWPSVVDAELARRVFWILYTKDKTDALSGRPLLLNDFEGTPPLPAQVDDEYITPAGALPQPEGRLSHMAGFTIICRIFQTISQTIRRHRSWAHPPDTEDDRAACVDENLAWIARTQAKLRGILDTLPPELSVDLREAAQVDLPQVVALAGADAPGADTAGTAAVGAEDRAKYAIRQSDIVLTGLCAEFSLLDFRAALAPALDTRAEREAVALRAYRILESIPVECLASNGECMRGKVLRIVLSLLAMSGEPETLSQHVWDWWNVYSRVQFLQVIPGGSGLA